MKVKHYNISLSSTGEVVAALDAAVDRRLSPVGEIEPLLDLTGRQGALMGGLLRSARLYRARK